ncbi:uncharacterized protein PpBr36_06643, partial [Pyricularia pennisetigena]|uniref:uncharacterized protein n=1 Tax=Pyricularia pennisetigena TaxID=1578925 RepID=UPI00114F433B
HQNGVAKRAIDGASPGDTRFRAPDYSPLVGIKLSFCPSSLVLISRVCSSSIHFLVFTQSFCSFVSKVPCTLHSLIRLVQISILLTKETIKLSRLTVQYIPHTAKMQFTTSVLSIIALAVSVSAHGRLVQPQAIKNTTPFENIRVPANGCGQGVSVDGPVQATFKAGSTGLLTWLLVNGDGGGPMAVSFDTTGKGTSFTTKAVVTKNVEGVNGGVSNAVARGNKPVEFQVPNVKCTRCVLQIRQDLQGGKDGFGSCAVVSIE